MAKLDWDDYPYADEFYVDDCNYEEEERQRNLAHRERLNAMTPEQLIAEWNQECRRHDSAVDRCEEINSPTIEDAAAWMECIEQIFKDRGLNFHDYFKD